MTNDPLTDALLRLLQKPQTEHRRGRMQLEAGSWHGHCKWLFDDLINDELFYSAANRPHDAPDLRAAIKKHAVELHDSGVIVTLDGQFITLERVCK